MTYVIPAPMKRIDTIDERFQSYNVEMLEVTGGKFWKPYGPELDALLLKGQQPAPTARSPDEAPRRRSEQRDCGIRGCVDRRPARAIRGGGERHRAVRERRGIPHHTED
jgi:hypothetical protein